MKAKIILILYLCISIPRCGEAQVVLLNENFNSSLPSTWTQFPAAASWSLMPGLGLSGSSCIGSQDLDMIQTQTLTIIRTATLDISAVSNISVSFNLAVIGNNFVIPNVSLSYTTAQGMGFGGRWGSGFSPNTTQTVSSNYDYVHPLDAQNVTWVPCTVTLAPVTSPTMSLIFNAEFVNGGYVLIDEVTVTGKALTSTGIGKVYDTEQILLFPNPVSNTNVTLSGVKAENILLYDVMGKVHKVEWRNYDKGIELNLGTVSKGSYYLTIYTDQTTSFFKKIVVD